MVDEKGKAITSGQKYVAAMNLANDFKNRGKLEMFCRKAPVYSGPMAFAANYVPQDVKIDARVEILPHREVMELWGVPEAVEGDSEPSEELSFQHGLKEGDFVKLHFLSSMTCQWQKMSERDARDLQREVEVEARKKAQALPESPGQEARRLGREAFQRGEYDRAAALYERALSLCAGKKDSSLASILYSNRAACLLSQGLLREALPDCNAALTLDPRNVKALLRRARALSCEDATILELQSAMEDLENVLEVEKYNKCALNDLLLLKQRMTESQEFYKVI